MARIGPNMSVFMRNITVRKYYSLVTKRDFYIKNI